MNYVIGALPFLALGLLVASVVISVVKKIKQQKKIDDFVKTLEEE